MADGQNRFETMPPRQKVTVIVFFIIIVYILWEVIGMFHGGGKTMTPNPAATVAASSTAASSPVKTPSSPPAVAPVSQMIQSHPPTQGMPESKSVIVSQPVPEAVPLPPLLVQQEQAQNRYVSALNELQMLKIQREIAETSQAIVTAKLATVTAEQSISTMLSPEGNKISPGSLGTGASSSSPVTQGSATYTVLSVTMELDKWHAVLKFQDKLYGVIVGGVLPPDGSTVTMIDQNGVTLQSPDGIEQKIPLTSTENT